VASGEKAGLFGWRSDISIAKMDSVIVEGELFAALPTTQSALQTVSSPMTRIIMFGLSDP